MSELRVSQGHLSECLIESDVEVMQRGRRLRRKALAISLVFEAAVLAALLAWPLLNPATLNAHYVSIPVPPYRRGAPERPRVAPHIDEHRPVPTKVLMQPLVIPPRVDSRPQPPPAIDAGNSEEGSKADGVFLGMEGGYDPLSSVHPSPPPRPEKPVSMPRKMSDGVMEAMLIHRVQPDYPESAKLLHLSGPVKLRAIVSIDGRVKELTVLSGNPILARAAIQAVSEWRYRPTLLNGQPVEVETLITVNFVLQ